MPIRVGINVWEEAGVQIVLECTGKFLITDVLEPYFRRDVRKVVIAAPVKQGALNIVMGVNDQLYDPELHHIVTPPRAPPIAWHRKLKLSISSSASGTASSPPFMM